ncbi:MAG: hypothetical protein AAFP03_10015 [Cyanobacteria bacterium J06598_3]
MRLFLPKHSFVLLLLVALIGCESLPQSTTTNTNTDPTPETADIESADIESDGSRNESTASKKTPDEATGTSSEEQPKDTPKPIFPALEAGTYCYEFDNDTKGLQARLTIDANDRVTGDVQGVIHDDTNAYYTSYRQAVDGTIDGSNLNVDVVTWIEYDQQNNQETWKVSANELKMERDTLSKTGCEQINKAFQSKNGLEAKDLTAGAENVRVQDVFFPAGESRTTLSNAVVRGDRDVYKLIAQGGQTINLSITALEDNAVFDIVAPSGIILGTELTSESTRLPDTGEYQIIVGGTRGNAAYELTITVE